MTFCEKSVHRVASSWRIQKNLLYRRIYQYRERTRIIQRVVTFHIVVIIEHIVAEIGVVGLPREKGRAALMQMRLVFFRIGDGMQRR